MTPNYAICQGEVRMEIPTCQSQMNAISFPPSEIFNTSNEGETRWTGMRRWFICKWVAPGRTSNSDKRQGGVHRSPLVNCHPGGDKDLKKKKPRKSSKQMGEMSRCMIRSNEVWVTFHESATPYHVNMLEVQETLALYPNPFLPIAPQWTKERCWSHMVGAVLIWLFNLHWKNFCWIKL